jgi:hypothetical protein
LTVKLEVVVTLLELHTTAAARDAGQPADRGVPVIDELPAHAAGLRFRFTDRNPLTGMPYASSPWPDLPYLIRVLIRDQLLITEAAWVCLLARSRVLDMVGPWQFWIPFTLDLAVDTTAVAHRRCGRPPDGVCGNCWGTGIEFDDDSSMTGTANALYVCSCMGAWL